MIYLDYNATTPVEKSVLRAMTPWFTDHPWNAASTHVGGRRASSAVEEARSKVGALLGARSGRLVWTSGATEATNLALKGAPLEVKRDSRLVTFAAEHKSVLDTLYVLPSKGALLRESTVLPVDSTGRAEPDRLAEELAVGDVGLVSVMAANNETGVLNDVKLLVALCHEHDVLVHVDATQAVGKVSFSVDEIGADLVSLSAHKMYGPKGVGALFVRNGLTLTAQIHGGGHERGDRSGTLNVPGIVGFGAAAELAASSDDSARQSSLLSAFVADLATRVGEVEVVAGDVERLPNTACLHVAADADAIIATTPDVCVSSGSACTSMVPEPSHVLRAMGFDDEKASECLRVSIGRQTTRKDLAIAAELLAASISRIREMTR